MTKRNLLFANNYWLFVLVLIGSTFATRHCSSQESPASQDQAPADSGDGKEQAKSYAEARNAIAGVADLLKNAKVSRATVELTSRSKVDGEEIQSQLAVYQVASALPNQYSAYLKATDGSFRIFCDGKETFVLVSPTAYYRAITNDNLQATVTNLPAPLGPYPEPVMAFTLCGVDPVETLFSDMESVQVIDREPYAGKPAVHLRGVQVDGVVWDLWLGTDKTNTQPLRMLVDLTEVVAGGEDSRLPENFSYELEFLFTLWRTTGKVDPKLFRFSPPTGSVEYESLDDYYESISEEAKQHPLVGMPAPKFEAEWLPATEGEQKRKSLAKLSSSDFEGEIVVLDFWASWCGPCINAMPVIDSVTKRFADKGVKFYAVNAGETEAEVRAFFETSKVKPNVLLDPSGEISNRFKAEAIPQTVIIGKDGTVQVVHVGYSSLESFEKELGEQLEVLASGGSLPMETSEVPPGNGK